MSVRKIAGKRKLVIKGAAMKKIAIMQPYFFPYPGYISLLKNTDEFILFDTPQIIRHGWIERNRIIKQNSGWLYIKVPLMPHSRDSSIQDIRINNSEKWKDTITAQLQVYKKIAPNYTAVHKLITEVLSKEYIDIVSLNYSALLKISEYLGINANIKIFSEMNLSIEEPRAPDEWALNICRSLGGVLEYWNLPGGKKFFDKSKYTKSGIDLKFHTYNELEYDQKREQFEPGLSIIDMLMFNSVEEVNKRLDDYAIE